MNNQITKITELELELLHDRNLLEQCKEELMELPLYKLIKKLEQGIFNSETLLKEQENKVINYLIDKNLKEFKTLDGKRLLLKKCGTGTLVGYDEKDISEDYFKIKEVRQLDKTRLKKDFTDGKINIPNAELKITYKLQYDFKI